VKDERFQLWNVLLLLALKIEKKLLEFVLSVRADCSGRLVSRSSVYEASIDFSQSTCVFLLEEQAGVLLAERADNCLSPMAHLMSLEE